MAKQRSSVRKREREIEKRQRELRKSKKAADKRERRLSGDEKTSPATPEATDSTSLEDNTGPPDTAESH